MKKYINKLASIILALAMLISFAPTANALSGTSFEHAKFAPLIHDTIANQPGVTAAYDKVQSLMIKYDAVVDQLNALNLDVYRVSGPIVSHDPYTVQYRLPTSEYVRVGDDYIKVTTYYHAVVANPQNGTESGGYYTGYHTRTKSGSLNNVNYIYYGSAGKTFNDLYASRMNYLTQYNAATAEYEVIADAAWDNYIATEQTNEEAARKIFANYVEFSPNRVMIDCAEGAGMDCSATVFQIGNPYYATGRGYIGSISTINGNTDMSAVPVINDGKTMVPVRPLIDSLTCEMTAWKSEYGIPSSAYVEFDSTTQTVEISIKASEFIPNCVSNTTIKLTINSNIAYVNDVEYVMDKPAQVISGKTMIPLRAVSEMLNCKVEWVPDGQFVVVSPKSIQEFRNPLWSSAKYETTIDGIAYHRVEEDLDFYAASYLLPDTFVSSKTDVYGYRVIQVGQIEIFLRATFDIQNGVSEQEYASTYDLNPFYLEDGTKGEHLYVAGDKNIYYLTIEDGGVETVTGIYFLQTGFLGAGASEEARARYRDEVSNNAKLMRPELLQFVKSFHRDAPVG